MELKLPDDGVLDHKMKKGYYLSRFGFNCDSNVIIHKRSNNNLSIGIRRLLNCREANIPGMDEWLKVRQTHVAISPLFLAQVARLQHLYELLFQDYQGRLEECEEHYDDPHAKRKFRISVWLRTLEGGEEMARVWTKVNEAKQKDEKAKINKYSRIYVNLGDASSLQGFVLLSLMKMAQAEHKYMTNGGEIEFVKRPARSALRKSFIKLLNPPKRFYACVFSDDSCLSIRDGGKITVYNLDISGCDASHGDAIFEAFLLLFPMRWRHEVLLILQQTKNPMKIRGLAIRKLMIKLLPTGYILPSGSVITTSLNTFVVFMIIWYITLNNIESEAEVKRAANLFGYILTAETCETPQDIQFLKHSPCYDTNGVMQPVLNFGVALRSSGNCVRDLPGRGPWMDRANAFQAGFINGLYPRVATRILDNMRRACGGRSNTMTDKVLEREGLFHKSINDEEEVLVFDTDEFFKRYRLTNYEMILVVEEFGCLTVGWQTRSAGLTKILGRDYGLSCNGPPAN